MSKLYKIKPLEWSENANMGMFESIPFGWKIYKPNVALPSGFNFAIARGYVLFDSRFQASIFPTLEEAKEYAEEDYKKFILLHLIDSEESNSKE